MITINNPPRHHRPRNHSHHKEPIINLPPFHGKDNIEEYLDCEMKLEQLFARRQNPD